MNLMSRVISGGVLVLVGVSILILPFLLKNSEMFFSYFYGIPILILGFFILFNKNEDEIEKIKMKGGKNG